MKTDKRIDSYILRSEPFARPILIKIRSLIQKNCPSVEETMKWSFPHFMYYGNILCSMAAFKNHCAFGFWKGSLIPELSDKTNQKGETAMGQFGKLVSEDDLPSAFEFGKYVKKAMKLTDENVKLPQRQRSKVQKPLDVPAYFLAPLKKNKKAFNTFENFNYSCRKEYVEWITEAKTKITRDKRIATAIEWMESGKDRNWKYKK